MELAMMDTTERHSKLIAHLAPERAWLRKANVMGITGCAAAHQARLPRDELAVLLVAQADGFCRQPLTAAYWLFLDRAYR